MWTDRLSFLSLFSNRKKRNLYYQGKEDFYRARNSLNTASSFNFHKDSIQTVHQTEKLIRFYGIELGENIKKIKRVFGRPNYKQKSNLPLDTQITLFYKLNLKGFKCILQMHLYDDQLFFAQMQLSDIQGQAKEEFLKIIRLKYKIEELAWGQALEDNKGTKITLIDDIVPKISYFSQDVALWKKISQELNQKAQVGSFSIVDLKKIALRWS